MSRSAYLRQKLLPIGLFLVGLAGCGRSAANAVLTVRITGPAGAQFTGQCTAHVAPSFISQTRAVGLDLRGVIITDALALHYQTTGETIYCSIRKLSVERPLTVTLLRDGRVVDQDQTMTPEGDMNVGYEPAERGTQP